MINTVDDVPVVWLTVVSVLVLMADAKFETAARIIALEFTASAFARASRGIWASPLRQLNMIGILIFGVLEIAKTLGANIISCMVVILTD